MCCVELPAVSVGRSQNVYPKRNDRHGKKREIKKIFRLMEDEDEEGEGV